MSFVDKKISPDNNITFFSPDDWQFIQDVSDRFPERVPSIIHRFMMLIECQKEKRERLALEMLKYEPRQGLVQRGYDAQDVESIYEHTRKMARLLGKLKKQNQTLKDRFPKNSARKFLCHDFGEAATTDFTPQDLNRITPEEKIRIEDMAMRLIFEHSPERYEAYSSYKEKATDYDRLIKVVDVLELMEDVARMTDNKALLQEIGESSEKILNKHPDIMRLIRN